MGLKATRSILAGIISLIIAAATTVTCIALVLNVTYATPSYITNNLVSDELVSACDKQLNAKYDALAAKSGIPARVFESVKNDFNTREELKLAAANLFNNESSTLYNQDRINYFYNLCTEYLEGNEIEYKEKYIRNVSDEAARIYSSCVGIHNADSVSHQLAYYKQKCAMVESPGLIVIAVSAILIGILYRKKEETCIQIISGIAGGGIATIIGSLLSIVLKVGSNIVFYPYAYQQAFYSMTKQCFVYMLICGILVTVFSYTILFIITQKLNKNKHRRNL